MGGRFGKYGDIKRKTRLRRSKALKKDLCRLKLKSQKRKKDKKHKPYSAEPLYVSVDFKP